MTDIHRIVYCSKVEPFGTQAQTAASIRSMLARSRLNNDRDGITGVLLFGGTCFAQVLEGRFDVVTATMDRIRRDRLHAGLTVLQVRDVSHRSFSDWSMAFARLAPGDEARGGELLSTVLDALPAAAVRLYGLLQRLAVEGERWISADADILPPFTNPARAD